jgi:hypothetical protein
MSLIDRRKFAGLALASVAAGQFATQPLFAKMTQGVRVNKPIDQLEPGEFTWHPERQKSGPVAIIVSIPDQMVHVYRGGVRIAVSTCSTGRKGHSTPTGVFTILQKDKHHRSSTYNNAPMPNMNRLTWSGIALHAGNLPGYPASHGCIRLPVKFSELLFTVTHLGTPVILANGHSQPRQVVHPGMVLSDYAEHEFEELTGKHFKTAASQRVPQHQQGHTTTAVLVSRESEEIMVLENGRIVAKGRAYIKNPRQPLGDHVFILDRPHNGRRGLAWHAIGHHPKLANGFHHPEEELIKRIGADKKVIEAMQKRMHPGLLMVMSDRTLHESTRSAHDFVIAVQDDA